VYAGAGGVLRTSTDAITWDLRTSGTTSQINALTYDNGIFTYVAAGGGMATSTDAITWSVKPSGTTSTLTAITYRNGLYLAGATGGYLGTSANTQVLAYTAGYDITTNFFVPNLTGQSTLVTDPIGTPTILKTFIKAKN
jgi:hypothetical protein